MNLKCNKDLLFHRTTYITHQIIKSDLVGMVIDGGMSKVSRGDGQTVFLDPKTLSMDPDYPEDRVRTNAGLIL